MEVNEILGNAKEQMEKSLDASKSRMEKIRTGRASAALVDSVRVDYYGTMSPLSQVAGVSVPDAGTIVIQPWDATTLPLIEKAIQQADLGFNPQNDGNIIRIHVPPLTEDRRIEFVKRLRNLRKKAKSAFATFVVI
jgi:ribosome recycling factor